MPKYSARQAELHLMLGPRGVPRPDDVMLQLKLSIDLWSGKREQLLVDLAERVATSHVRSDLLSESWKRLVQAARAELTYDFGVCGVKILMNPELRREWQLAHREEDAFLEQLLASPVCACIEQMNRFAAGMSQVINELDQKWTSLQQAKGDILSQEQRAVAEAERVVMAALSTHESLFKDASKAGNEIYLAVTREVDAMRKVLAAKLGSTIVEQLEKKAVKDIVKMVFGESVSPAAKEGLKALGTGIQYIIGRYGNDSARYLACAESYRSSLRTDGSILQMFRANRDLVAAYERDNNLSKMDELRRQAIAGLQSWVDARPKPAMKTDASAFMNDVVQSVQATYDRCKAQDENFRRKFQGLFTGPLSDQNFELLGNRYIVEQQLGGLKASRADQRLRSLGDQLKAHLLAEVGRTAEPIAALAGELPGTAGEFLLLSSEEFRSRVQAEVAVRLDELIRASLDFTERLSTEKVDAAFGREELARLLR